MAQCNIYHSVLRPALLLWILIFSLLSAQYSVQAQGMGGASTGEARTYSSRRTVGIVDPNAPVIFRDFTVAAGLASFRHRSGSPEKKYILETPSGGVALFDYDNDGLIDIYLLNGSTFAAEQGKEPAPKAALYHNLGNWKFENVTDRAGLANQRWGMGVAVGDYNNDGYPDLYVSNFGISRLYRNNGNGTFTDVAPELGAARRGWSTGATFGDYDGDGRLDLFVPGYLEFDINHPPAGPVGMNAPGSINQNYCQFRGQPVMCGPRGLKGEGDTLYHQKSDGTFEDVSVKAGVSDSQGNYGFSSAFVHLKNDALLDLLVINDSTANLLYFNKGNGAFEESGYLSGAALNEGGREQAGMGVALGDYNNDGLIDFYVTNFSDDYNTLRRNDGDGNFTDVSFQSGQGEVTLPFLGWGTSFVDYDNDGWKDIIVANGHVYPGVDSQQWGTSYSQQLLLLKNLRNGKFERVGAAPGSGLSLAVNGRGLAVGDLDNDGKLDLVVNCMDSAPLVLRNVSAGENNWLTLRLIGDPLKKSPRDATGAVAYLTAGGVKERADVISGAGYASQNDSRVHFGLGTSKKIDKLEIRWPSGLVERYEVPAINRILSLTEGRGTKSP